MLDPLEWRLLATSLCGPSGITSAGPDQSLEGPELIASCIERGDYLAALQCPSALALLSPASGAGASADEYYPAVQERAREALASASGDPSAALAVLATGVASFYAFLQDSLTGPPWKGPDSPQDLGGWVVPETPQHRPGEALPERPRECPGDKWARTALREDGEDVVGRHGHIQYLYLARTLLTAPILTTAAPHTPGESPEASLSPAGQAALAAAPTFALWAFRTLVVQQRVLEGNSATLRSSILVLIPACVAVTDMGMAAGAEGYRAKLKSMLQMEVALMEHSYGYVDRARLHLEKACAAAGLQIHVVGRMGLRTHHQVDAKPQLVADTESTDDGAESGDESTWQPQAPSSDTSDVARTEDGQIDIVAQEMKGLMADSDVLDLPTMSDGSLTARLSPTAQALLLAQAIHVKKATAADELQPWEMAPYVEAVLGQPRSRPLVQLSARLHRARHERTRNRTRERALLTMESLGEAVAGPIGPGRPGPERRMPLALATWFPLTPALRKEVGEVMLGMGLIGAAMEIFERLELWDSLITCYRLLGKKVQAEELVRQRLAEEPDEARLWCALGDLTLDESHYLTGWERSGHRSARAQRSLAYAAHRKQEYERSAGHWEMALALSPLQPQGWFTLGHCYIKTQNFENALRAFTRCCQLEPDNGEAWNNLAAVLMHLNRNKQAYSALGEALRHKRDSWQTWENYARCAVEAGQFQHCAKGLARVLELTQGSRCDAPIVRSLVEQLARIKGVVDKEAAVAADATPSEPTVPSSSAPASDSLSLPTEMNLDSDSEDDGQGVALSDAAALDRAVVGEEDGIDARGRARLFDSITRLTMEVFKRAINGTSAGADLWATYARLHNILGDGLAEKEALLKTVRALQGGQWQKEEDKFRAFAAASLDLCRCYVRLAGAPGGRAGDLGSARMHLRSVLKQSSERFEEHPDYRALEAMLAEVVEKEEAAKAAREAGSGGQ